MTRDTRGNKPDNRPRSRNPSARRQARSNRPTAAGNKSQAPATKNRQPMILIVGAGITGLSAAFHLRDLPIRLIEKEDVVGGLCRSIYQDGFTFDWSGHLLSLGSDDARSLLIPLLKENLRRHKRRAAVLWKGISVPYPFQANLGVLPKEVVRECLLGFIQSMFASRGEKRGLRKGEKRDFHSWVLETFGEGIASHFMIPYNQKMWHVALEEMTDDWVSWSVPKPTLEEVLDGVLGIQGSTFGYNAEFFYPEAGGIESVPKAFFEEIVRFTDPLLDMEVEKIDLGGRLVHLNGGECLAYTHLISTIPLPVLLEKAERLCPSTAKAHRNLRSIGVLLFNIGLSRPPETDLHWIYFPERDYPFFRAGVYSNFSKSLVPRGCGSLYVEVSYPTGKRPDQEALLKRVIDGLVDARLILDEKDVATVNVQDISYGYVIFDHYRRANLHPILSELESKGVYSIGRYGAWDYLTMEGAMLQGKGLAERLRRRLG